MIPAVLIGNSFEANASWLQGYDASVAQRFYSADERVLFWYRPNKLVLTSSPAAHWPKVQQQLHYHQTHHVYVTPESGCICRDILSHSTVLATLIDYATDRVLELIPYCTTPDFLELARYLEAQGITILLPETPTQLWLRDYIDSKTGFRSIASQWIHQQTAQLPEGYTSTSFDEASQMARWFLDRGKACVVKADRGTISLARLILRHLEPQSSIADKLKQHFSLSQSPFIVEEWIDNTQPLSPSIEVCITPDHTPVITHTAIQFFTPSGLYSGELTGPELMHYPWHATLVETAQVVGQYLGHRGYLGHFDLDCVIDQDHRVYLLELNARRTGGTHTHELPLQLLGPSYKDSVTVLSNQALQSSRLRSIDALWTALEPWLYPINSDRIPYGLIVTNTGRLSSSGSFGCIFLGPSIEAVLALQTEIQQHLQ